MPCPIPSHTPETALLLLQEMHGGPFPTIHDAIEYGLNESMSAPNDELADLMLEPVSVLLRAQGDAERIHYTHRLEMELAHISVH